MFSRKEFRPLGFSRQGEYIGGRAMSGGGPGGYTPGGTAGGGDTPPYGVAGLWSASSSPLDFVFMSGN
jgi:hypothetical protein